MNILDGTGGTYHTRRVAGCGTPTRFTRTHIPDDRKHMGKN